MAQDYGLAIILFVVGYILGCLTIVACFILTPGQQFADVNHLVLSNSTAHDICLHLTNNSAVQASADDGRLVCSEPSYDHTQNIIIKSNGGAE